MIPEWNYPEAVQTKPSELHNPPLGDLLEYGLQQPDKIAIMDHRQQFTFAELDRLSKQFAWLLAKDFAVQPGQPVMILTKKYCLVPALAIALWQLGAIYAPFDGESPVERIASVANQLQPALVIDLRSKCEGQIPLMLEQITLEELLRRSKDYNTSMPFHSYTYADDDVVYILHTSGSTGQPKGVQITEHNLKSYFRAHNEVLRFNRSAKVFSLTPFHFDVSIEDTILPLSVGATVYQYNRLHHGAMIRKTLIQQNVTHLIAVSTLLTMISDAKEEIRRENFPNLSMVMTGAEVCAPKVINLWKQRLPDTRVINAYGPTEVTIVATCYIVDHVEPEREIAYPIGQPLAGVKVLLLDTQGQPVVPGNAGELCLGGAQVMLGYFKQPQENQVRLFIHEGVRYYRTGDICFLNNEGQLQFLGREDGEVKINGRRINLGEVQQQCMAVSGVEHAAIGVHQCDGQSMISAVLISSDEGIVDPVKTHLNRLLPAYMIPVIWGVCKEVALSTTGKSNDRELLAQLRDAFDQQRLPVISLSA